MWYSDDNLNVSDVIESLYNMYISREDRDYLDWIDHKVAEDIPLTDTDITDLYNMWHEYNYDDKGFNEDEIEDNFDKSENYNSYEKCYDDILPNDNFYHKTNNLHTNEINRNVIQKTTFPSYDDERYKDWIKKGIHRIHRITQTRYDVEGFNIHGYNAEGWNREGWNRQNVNYVTLSRYDIDGFDRNGYDIDGFDRNNYDKDGYDRNGFFKDGYDKEGFDKEGFDKDGFNRYGFNRSCDKKYKFEKMIGKLFWHNRRPYILHEDGLIHQNKSLSEFTTPSPTYSFKHSIELLCKKYNGIKVGENYSIGNIKYILTKHGLCTIGSNIPRYGFNQSVDVIWKETTRRKSKQISYTDNEGNTRYTEELSNDGICISDIQYDGDCYE